MQPFSVHFILLGTNHFIFPISATHVSVVVVTQFELSGNMALLLTLCCVDDIGLVNSRKEIYFPFVFEVHDQHVFMLLVPMLTLWGIRVLDCGL